MTKNDTKELLYTADELEERGDLAGASDLLEAAVAHEPENPRLRALHGRLLYLESDRALESKPDAATTLCFRGRSRSMVNDLDGAIADFLRVIELQPNSPDAFTELGHVHYFRRDWGQALQAFSPAVELDPNRLSDLSEKLNELRQMQPAH